MIFSSNKGKTHMVSAVSSSTWGIPDLEHQQQSISWMVRSLKYIIYMHSLHDTRIKINNHVSNRISDSEYEIRSTIQILHIKQWRNRNIICESKE